MTGKVTRLDNHRVFRAEAVEAYATRRAGDAWIARLRGENWIVAALTLLATSGLMFLILGSR
ncbi:MAG TPA: hypothetical protein VMB03_20990 [Bryobacteraceae bacterium]|nr:hypothetical protein [Bryobacteraceae bacterium]